MYFHFEIKLNDNIFECYCSIIIKVNAMFPIRKAMNSKELHFHLHKYMCLFTHQCFWSFIRFKLEI